MTHTLLRGNKRNGIFIIALFFHINTFAQFELLDKIDSTVNATYDVYKNPNYLKPIIGLRNIESIFEKADSDSKSFFYQYLAFHHSFIANYDSARIYFDKALMTDLGQRKYMKLKPLNFSHFQAKSAKEYILERAKNERVIMLNEAHQIGQHRAFATSLLPGLYKLGFRHLLVETLAYRDSLLNDRGYPVMVSGYYSVEPAFGNFIRQAIKLGFKVLPYEANKRGLSRAKQQAMNIQQVLQQNPKSKILVYAGIQNLEEKHKGKWVKMGEEFKNISGINPFTIDQSEMTERSNAQYEHPYYQQVLKKGWLKEEPIILRYQNKPWVADTGNLFVNYVDVQVFHPRTQLKNRRPSWLTRGGKRHFYKISPKKWSINRECLVQAFAINDEKDAVPYDQIHITIFDKPSFLVLPKGKFIIKALDENKKILKTEKVRIK